MSRSERLTAADVRGVHWLLCEVRDARHDPAAMHRTLIDGLLGLVGGTCGFACEVADWRVGGDLRVRSLAPDSASGGAVAGLMRGLAVNNSLWDDPSIAEGVRRTAPVEATPFHAMVPHDELRRRYPVFWDVKRDFRHADHLLAWHRLGPQGGDMRGVSVHRWGRGERRFGAREAAIARVVFEEIDWLHATGRLTPPVPGLADLPPRMREVLDGLAAGDAPKQIARRLGLSVHTVRDHVKRLYARTGVESRGELMALLGGGGGLPGRGGL